MMRRISLLLSLPALLEAQAPVPPKDVLKAFDHMAARTLWPGFEPAKIPLAIYNGQDTWLVRHPRPPAGFREAADGWWVSPGRHEAVTANTSALLGGVKTATLMSNPPASAAALAAILIHECFHVHQREKHPAWSGNEGELLTYPFEDADVLRLRWEEEADLWRALRAASTGEAKAYALRAMNAREARFQRIGTGAAGYERGSELNEGLANIVQFRATSKQALDGAEPPRIASERLRSERFYAVGPALGQLLDRFAPGWEQQLIAGATASLDQALRAAVMGASLAGLPPQDAALKTEAERAAAEVASSHRRSLEAYLQQPGWSLEWSAEGGEPFFLQGFDPTNVQRLAPAEVLHSRFLKLGNKAGSLELLGQAGLTRAVGPHPLWNGVAVLRICGLKRKPEVEVLPDGSQRVSAEGLTATFKGLKAVWEGQRLILHLSQAIPNPTP